MIGRCDTLLRICILCPILVQWVLCSSSNQTSVIPIMIPTRAPTFATTSHSTSKIPSFSLIIPSTIPSISPQTVQPSFSRNPSRAPTTGHPSVSPTVSVRPTSTHPSLSPTTGHPTRTPTTGHPSVSPTISVRPTSTHPSVSPTLSNQPTRSPSRSHSPTIKSTRHPTISPSISIAPTTSFPTVPGPGSGALAMRGEFDAFNLSPALSKLIVSIIIIVPLLLIFWLAYKYHLRWRDRCSALCCCKKNLASLDEKGLEIRQGSTFENVFVSKHMDLNESLL